MTKLGDVVCRTKELFCYMPDRGSLVDPVVFNWHIEIFHLCLIFFFLWTKHNLNVSLIKSVFLMNIILFIVNLKLWKIFFGFFMGHLDYKLNFTKL